MRLRSTLTAAAAYVSSACAGVLGIPDDPELVIEQAWSCLAQPAPTPVSVSESVTVRVQACDFVSRCTVAVTGLTARLCAKTDPDCTSPVGAGVTDVDGLLELEAPTTPAGFDGYIEVTSSTAPCADLDSVGDAGAASCARVAGCDPRDPEQSCDVPTYARSLLSFNPPLVAAFERPYRLPLLASHELPAVFASTGAELDPTTGALFITAADCEGVPAAGVTYAIDQLRAPVTQLYTEGGVASATALATDASGMGGFLTVPSGAVEVSAYNSDLERIGVIEVQSAPLTMTYAVLVPPL